LLVGDLGAVERLTDVRVGDRLTLHAHLFATHRDRLLDLLGHHILPQPRTPTLALGRADPQLLLRARHRLVGARATRVTADRTTAGCRLGVLGRGDRALVRVGDPVVAEELS